MLQWLAETDDLASGLSLSTARVQCIMHVLAHRTNLYDKELTWMGHEVDSLDVRLCNGEAMPVIKESFICQEGIASLTRNRQGSAMNCGTMDVLNGVH